MTKYSMQATAYLYYNNLFGDFSTGDSALNSIAELIVKMCSNTRCKNCMLNTFSKECLGVCIQKTWSNNKSKGGS